MATVHRNTKNVGADVRRLVVEMSHRSRSGETGSALSISDILAVLYFKVMRNDPKKPHDPNRDRFVLSKGHGAAALYATLALRGYFDTSLLVGHRINGGVFHGHPSMGAAPGIEVSTGSLGHGLSIAVGMAYALQKTKSNVYVLVGDGECNEGSVWEAALSAGALMLPNIVAIVDSNKFQGFGAARDINPFDLARQWESFGWRAMRVDGHDTHALERALKSAARMRSPIVVIADTVAGKGVASIEDTLRAHYYVPDDAALRSTK